MWGMGLQKLVVVAVIVVVVVAVVIEVVIGQSFKREFQ
jgi:hypothetical protein